MSRPSRATVGATPGKLALIGVLAVVLVAVIASNWRAAPTDGTPEETTDANLQDAGGSSDSYVNQSAGGVAGNDSQNPFGDFAADDDWPETPLREATAFDPLAVASWAMPPKPPSDPEEGFSENDVQELLAAKNAIIFLAGNKQVALIGDQEFEVGDRIGRFKISEINAQGVVLSENE